MCEHKHITVTKSEVKEYREGELARMFPRIKFRCDSCWEDNYADGEYAIAYEDEIHAIKMKYLNTIDTPTLGE